MNFVRMIHDSHLAKDPHSTNISRYFLFAARLDRISAPLTQPPVETARDVLQGITGSTHSRPVRTRRDREQSGRGRAGPRTFRSSPKIDGQDGNVFPCQNELRDVSVSPKIDRAEQEKCPDAQGYGTEREIWDFFRDGTGRNLRPLTYY